MAVLDFFGIVALGFTACFIVLTIGEIRELFFYWNNEWDFSRDNSISWVTFYNQRRMLPSRPENAMSNRTRVLRGRPLAMFVIGIFSAVFPISPCTRTNGGWRQTV